MISPEETGSYLLKKTPTHILESLDRVGIARADFGCWIHTCDTASLDVQVLDIYRTAKFTVLTQDIFHTISQASQIQNN